MNARSIQNLRRQLGLSQRKFAALLRVSQAAVQKWEDVESATPPTGDARRQLEILHTTIDRTGREALLKKWVLTGSGIAALSAVLALGSAGSALGLIGVVGLLGPAGLMNSGVARSLRSLLNQVLDTPEKGRRKPKG